MKKQLISLVITATLTLLAVVLAIITLSDLSASGRAFAGSLAANSLSELASAPEGCEPNYTFQQSFGNSIEPGTTLVADSQCDDCGVTINLPFPYTLYDETYTRLVATSNGQLDFGEPADRSYTNSCLPNLFTHHAIFAHWRDLTLDFQNVGCEYYPNYPQNCGMFTSVTGTAPNRKFNIEYRALSWDHSLPVHFAVQLYENAQRFDIIYEELDAPVSSAATIGVERDETVFAQYQCPGQPNVLVSGLRLIATLNQSCVTPTETPTSQATPTGTPTSTPSFTNSPTNTPINTHTPTNTSSPTNSPTITHTAVPGTVILRGHLLLQGRPAAPNPRWIVPISATLRLAVGGPVYNFVSTTDQEGYFVINTNLQAGDYAWWVKNPQTLANSGTATLVAGLNTIEIGMLLAGDATNDNCNHITDFSILKVTYGRSIGEPGYDARSDFNSDNIVNISDFNLLKGNYGLCGAPSLVQTTPGPTATPTSTSSVVLVGHVTVQGRPAQPHPLQSVPLTVSLRLSGGNTNQYNVTSNQSGFFTITTGLTPGSYTWRVKSAQTLANAGSVTLVGGVNNAEMGLLDTGDASDDNCIAVSDFNIVKLAFGKTIGEPGYDPRADFNGDNVITLSDFNLLKGNYSQCGAPPILIR